MSDIIKIPKYLLYLLIHKLTNIVVSDVEQDGYSVGLYAKVRGIDTKKAYKELLERECFSVNKSAIEISPINLLADVEIRDAVYLC